MNPDHARTVGVAAIVAAAFAVAALTADRAGCTVQGYTGVALGVGAYGAALRAAAQRDRQRHVSASQVT